MHDITNFTTVLKACEAAGGAGSKAAIKDALKTLTPGARTLFKYAMDPFLVFGVKKFDRMEKHHYSGTDNADIKIITRTLDKLADRTYTGNAARTAVATMLAEFTWETAAYLERIIDKDLQAGFSPDTYNKIWKEDQVRVFNVMLADKCVEEEDFEAIEFPCIGDIKYDGERNVCFQLIAETNFAPAGSSYRSRSGKIAEHMAGLFDEELARIREYLGYDFVLDGERMAKDYIDTINAKKSGAEGEAGKKNMRFRAFFLMPLTDWIAQKCSITMKQNRIALEKILIDCKCEKITLSKAREVKDFADMTEYVDEVTTPGYDGMPKGQEGLILKRNDAEYQWDRTIDWCKCKKFFDFEAVILNFELGKKRNAKRMGRVNVAGYLEDGTFFEVGVGSGWKDADREDCAANFEAKWKGKIMQGKYQEVSLGKNKKYHSLRFPTALPERGWRDDKTIELPY